MSGIRQSIVSGFFGKNGSAIGTNFANAGGSTFFENAQRRSITQWMETVTPAGVVADPVNYPWMLRKCTTSWIGYSTAAHI